MNVFINSALDKPKLGIKSSDSTWTGILVQSDEYFHFENVLFNST